MTRFCSVILFVAAFCGAVGAQVAPADKYFDSNGVRIRYVEAGSGPPIILVHGFARSLDSNWLNTGVFARLSASHRVIAFDLRGHGKSGKPHDPHAYLDDLHLDVVRLMDHLHIARAHLAGCSVVGRVAITNPQRVASVILGAGTILHGVWEPSDDEDAKKEAADVKSDPPFRNLAIRLTPVGQRPTEESIRTVSSLLAEGTDLDALAAFRLAGGRGQVSSDEDVAATKVPVLAIVGDQDATVNGVRNFHMLLPSAQVVEITGATHAGESSAARRPEFTDAILRFVAEHK